MSGRLPGQGWLAAEAARPAGPACPAEAARPAEASAPPGRRVAVVGGDRLAARLLLAALRRARPTDEVVAAAGLEQALADGAQLLVWLPPWPAEVGELRQRLEATAEVRLVAFGIERAEDARRAARAGARALLGVDEGALEEIGAVLERVLRGESYVSPGLPHGLLLEALAGGADGGPAALAAVCRQVLRGQEDDAAAAARVGCPLATLRAALAAELLRLGARSRLEGVARLGHGGGLERPPRPEPALALPADQRPLERRRLLAGVPPEASLVLIEGPLAGGKTTLARQLAARWPGAVWVDAGSLDPAGEARWVQPGPREAGSAHVAPVEHAPVEHASLDPGSAEAGVVREVRRRLAGLRPGQGLVVDEAQRLAPCQAALEEVVQRLRAETPPGSRLMLVGTALPLAAAAGWRRAHVVDGAALLLDADEAREWAGASAAGHLERSGGWPGALLAARQGRLDAWLAEVVAPLHDELWEWLLVAASSLDLDAARLEAIAGRAGAAQACQRLLRAGLLLRAEGVARVPRPLRLWLRDGLVARQPGVAGALGRWAERAAERAGDVVGAWWARTWFDPQRAEDLARERWREVLQAPRAACVSPLWFAADRQPVCVVLAATAALEARPASALEAARVALPLLQQGDPAIPPDLRPRYALGRAQALALAGQTDAAVDALAVGYTGTASPALKQALVDYQRVLVGGPRTAARPPTAWHRPTEPVRARIALHTLGTLAVDAQGVGGIGVGARPGRAIQQRLAVLLYLLWYGPTRRERLIDALFGEGVDARRAAARLRVLRTKCRLDDGEPLFQLEADPAGTHRLHPAAAVAWDVQSFCDAVDAGERVGRSDEGLRLRTEAVSLFAGPFLAEVDLPWVNQIRWHCERKLAGALATLAGAARDRGDDAAAERWESLRWRLAAGEWPDEPAEVELEVVAGYAEAVARRGQRERAVAELEAHLRHLRRAGAEPAEPVAAVLARLRAPEQPA